MNNITQTLTVFNSPIRVKDNLYCLTDLYRASGSNQKHRPKYFLANRQTKELIEVIQKGGITPIMTKGGRSGGTYAHKNIVYLYAMWISAEFANHVISVFDGVQSGQQGQEVTEAILHRVSQEAAKMVQEGIMKSYRVFQAVANSNSHLSQEQLAEKMRGMRSVGGLSVVNADKLLMLDTCLNAMRGLNCE